MPLEALVSVRDEAAGTPVFCISRGSLEAPVPRRKQPNAGANKPSSQSDPHLAVSEAESLLNLVSSYCQTTVGHPAEKPGFACVKAAPLPLKRLRLIWIPRMYAMMRYPIAWFERNNGKTRETERTSHCAEGAAAQGPDTIDPALSVGLIFV